MSAADAERGRAAREATPRGTHGDWAPPGDRRDPVAVLIEQDTIRVPDLVPIRHGRMLATPFAFYRGAAAIMAADLATMPRTGLQAQLCGDAHLSNFGGFQTPDGTLVFGLDDFDETLPGPWEWDVKRLAASVEIAAADRGADEDRRAALVLATAGEYRRAMRELAAKGLLDVWYPDARDAFALQLEGDSGAAGVAAVRRAVAQATDADSLRAVERLTHVVDGRLRFISAPPLIVPIEELVDAGEAERTTAAMGSLLDDYRQTLSDDRRELIERYRYVHLARKVVGVGSVGTRTWVVLLEGRDARDALVLQVKEAQASVLEPQLGPSAYPSHGQRVVEGHRLMAPAADVFVGWTRVGLGGTVPVDHHVRHRWRRRGATDVSTMGPGKLGAYAAACALALARSHARSPDGAAIAAYLGAGDVFDRALVRFAKAYAEVNAADHAALAAAVRDGRVTARTGV